MTIPIGAVVAAAATLAVAGAVGGALAPERLRRVVAEHPARTTACVMVPLTASVAMAIAHSVVRARQGTCPQPLRTAADGASTSLCEVAAPWLQAWAAGLGAIALLVGGIAIGTLLRASSEERRARSTAASRASRPDPPGGSAHGPRRDRLPAQQTKPAGRTGTGRHNRRRRAVHGLAPSSGQLRVQMVWLLVVRGAGRPWT